MRSVFGWSYPPGVSSVPGDEPQPPSCEECPEEQFEKCPGQDKCQEVYLDSSPACCVEHKIEMSGGECGECEADCWATIDLDLTTAKDRVRLLRAGFTKSYPKRIEKLYLDVLGTKVRYIKTYEPHAFAGTVFEVSIPVMDLELDVLRVVK